MLAKRRSARRRADARQKLIVDLMKDYAIALMVAAWFQPLVNGSKVGLANYAMILLSLVFTTLAFMLARGDDHDKL